MAKIAYFLKEDFHPYIQVVLPQLLEDTKL